MPYNFYKNLLKPGTNELYNMPPISIDNRDTDKKVIYNKNFTRIDRISGDIYEDETLGRLIMWANPEYDYEYDIPDGAVIRVPFPLNAVLQEINTKINITKNLG
jgi:hypothetical protein